MTRGWAQTQVLRLSWAVVLLAFAVILAAAVNLERPAVSGDCLSWGECSGWTYLTKSGGAIGAGHLAAAGMIATVTVALVAVSWMRLRQDQRIVRAAMIALVLMLIQGAAVVAPSGSPIVDWAAPVHLGATVLLLAVGEYLIVLSTLDRARTSPSIGTPSLDSRQPTMFRVLVAVAAVTVFGVLISGAVVAASDTAGTCAGWPLCESSSSGAVLAAQVHRLAVLASGISLLALVVAAMRNPYRAAAHAQIVVALIVAFVLDVVIGAVTAGSSDRDLASVAHFAIAGATWALVVLLGLLTAPTPGRTILPNAPRSIRSIPHARVARDYLRVTKPGIMTLLLTTTLGSMLVAASGWPGTFLVAATLLGGALASGGASALNCYLDRDVDVIMARTRRRPLPTGRLTAAQVRNFGLLLSGMAVVELAVLVNPIAAVLALAGNLFYVVVYTRWLKRSTPQNIVIGGAAGAFPPLVGWAAVTGSIELPALILFAVIYYWTPPHFWSLALLKSRDYERAGIPMLPVTHGDQQTRKFILLYALLLVGITIVPVVANVAGLVYLSVALMLGCLFVGLAIRMYVEGTSRLAWGLFKFSNYYLALLLAAMVLDRVASS